MATSDVTVKLNLDATEFGTAWRKAERRASRRSRRVGSQLLLGLAQVASACTAYAMVVVTGSWWAFLAFVPCEIISAARD